MLCAEQVNLYCQISFVLALFFVFLCVCVCVRLLSKLQVCLLGCVCSTSPSSNFLYGLVLVRDRFFLVFSPLCSFTLFFSSLFVPMCTQPHHVSIPVFMSMLRSLSFHWCFIMVSFGFMRLLRASVLDVWILFSPASLSLHKMVCFDL
eukprot:m.353278 g.353278  ORF g.353278 m.353278 type:complete len:148 (+) comp16720_c0_seq1:1540-1983(+)